MRNGMFTTLMDLLKPYERSEKKALICGEETLTYRQLILDSKRIAAGLMEEGVRKGDRVLLCMESSADTFRAMMGILYAGASFVAADPEWPEERIRFASEDAKTSFALTGEVCRTLLKKENVTAPLPEVGPEDEAAVYYTSGSTGKPKGVVLHHAVFGSPLSSDFSNRLESHPEFLHWKTSICMFRLPFVAAMIDLCIIFSEEKTMLMPTDRQLYSIDLFLELIRNHHPEVIASTPSIIARFLEHPEFARLFADFGYAFLGGEPLSQAAAKKLSAATKAKLFVVYGCTEMFFTASFCYRNDGIIHLGRPGYHVRLYVLDDRMEEVPCGQEGELYIGGDPAKYGHYLNQPELDREVYVTHPVYGRLYRTGDVCRREDGGELSLMGRADRMVKLHGQRIETGEVENAISSFPGVTRAAVMIQKYEGTDALCAFYAAAHELDDRKIRKHLSKCLPMYMIPAFLKFLPDMPVNAHGKLEYKKLPLVEKEKPLISVLTPVHNTPLEYLERAMHSVLAQDYDQRRIEWLIGVHNMDEEYEENLRSLVRDVPGVRVLRVQEPVRLVGAVRSVLLKEAAGQYLFWLDADDELTPDCVSSAVRIMEQKNADMLLRPCEEIHDGGTQMFPRCLNAVGKGPLVFERGDPGLGEILTGCALDVWSWGWRASFLKEAGIDFNVTDVGHACEPLFVTEAFVRAERIAVLPESRSYRYHILPGSISQNMAWNEMFQTFLSMARLMELGSEAAEGFGADANLYLWFWIRNAIFLFSRADVKPEQKVQLYQALLPSVKKLRILTPGPVFPLESAQFLSGYISAMFPENTETFQRPQLGHAVITCKMLPSEEAVRGVIRKSGYAGFHTVSDERYVFLGKTGEAEPGILHIDLPKQKGKEFLQSYQHMEEMRGFEPGEVPLRISLFHKEGKSGELLITWDARFFHESVIRWLKEALLPSMEMQQTFVFTTLLDRLERYAESESTALVIGEEKLSYRELIADAKHIGKGMVQEGLKKGDRVLFSMNSSLDTIRGIFGVLYAGGAYIAADPEWPEERILFVKQNGEAVFSMSDEDVRRLLEKECSQAELPEVSGGDEAAVYYTSGSTGDPKGAVLRHIMFGSVLGSVLCEASAGNAEPMEWNSMLCLFRNSFVAVLACICTAFTQGKTLILTTDEERASLNLLTARLQKSLPDVAGGTPSMILRFLEDPAFAKEYAKVRIATFGGERITPSVLQKLSGKIGDYIKVVYASSEMFFTAEYLSETKEEVHLGQPGYGLSLYLLDPKGKPVSPGEEGELYIGGISAQYGHYLNRPDLDAEAYTEHPQYGRLFRSGDFGILEESGEITLVGRDDGMVKLHGQRIETGEVERAVQEFSRIRRAAVKLIGESPREALACYFTASEEIKEADLRTYLADRLPYYMVPSFFVRLEEMPENEHGKLNVKALPEISLPKEDYVPPETEAEKILCEVFSRVLKETGPIGVTDSLLALGVDSISAMTAAAYLLEQGYIFEPRLVFVAPTIRQLAPLLKKAEEKTQRKEDIQKHALGEEMNELPEALARTVGREQVESCYPVMRVVKEKLDDRASYLAYFLWEVNAETVQPEEWKQRLQEITDKHQALRSVFLLSEDGSHRQIVLRKHTVDAFCADLRGISDGEGMSRKQKAYFRELIRLDAERKRDLEKEVLFRAGLIRITESKSLMLLGFSHLLLDGTGVAQIVKELMEPVKILPDKGLWERRTERLYFSDHSAAMEYWNHLLAGCDGYTQLPCQKEQAEEILPAQAFAAFGNRFYDQIVQYCSAHQVTAAAVFHFAFGRTLMELLGVDDVCFLSEGNGRGVEDAKLPGMFILHFPVRLNRKTTLTECQAQLVSSAALMDVCGVREIEEAVGWSPYHGVINVQNIYHENGADCKAVDLQTLMETPDQIREMERTVLPTHMEKRRWLFRVNMIDQHVSSCTVMYNAICYEEGLMKQLAREYLKQLKKIIEDCE